MSAAGAAVATEPRWIALVGPPNVGKSALFNRLTGLDQRVANYPGVTVEQREGRVRGVRSGEVRVVDLPGIRSLVARAPDERITADVLLGRLPGAPKPAAVVVVADAGQLGRGLFILGQVLECGVPVVLALNMVDEARRSGIVVDPAKLSAALGGVPVVPTVATTGEGLAPLVEEVESALLEQNLAPPLEIPGVHGLPKPSPARWDALRDAVESAGLVEDEVRARWTRVRVLLDVIGVGGRGRDRKSSDRCDRWLLHPVLGPLVFLLVMGTVFQAVFSFAEVPMAWIEDGFGALSTFLRGQLGNGLVVDALLDGVLAGIGGVLVFLPQILILFAFLGVLEDSGYLTRAAFLVDRPLRSFGLSGRSFIPLLSSFACAVPGILATRSIEDRRERFLAILVAPLMTCSARLPIYTLLISAFIPDRDVLGVLGLQGLVLLGLYLLGLVLAAIAAIVMNRALRRSAVSVPMVLELAPYRWPTVGTVLLRLGQKALQFLRRAGTVILAVSIILWALLRFPTVDPLPGETKAAHDARQVAQSAAGRLGHALEPIIAPLGYDWRIGVGLVGSFAAREVFVSTMAVVYAAESDDDAALAEMLPLQRHDRSGAPIYTLATVLSLLVFYAVALQCISTVAVVFRETRSWRWAASQLGAFTAAAWVAALVTYQAGVALGAG